MTLRKIADVPSPCSHPEHNPPMHIVLENGVYEHTCPQCGHKVVFTVLRPTCEAHIWTTDKKVLVQWESI